MTKQAADDIRDIDRDSLHILPLSIVPIETLALKRARLIKNARLQSIIEFFGYKYTGSGQVEIEDLGGEFGWPEIPAHPDLVLLRKLGDLPSYDVYSLRILLRDHGIAVNNVDALKLSPAKQSELTEYMTSFTRPLIMQIFGGEDVSIQSFEDVIRLFRNPDLKKAREKLKIMAEKLEIGIEDVPKFLEDYGDIFLSLSYYRQCLDQIEPTIDMFLDALDEIRGNWQLKNDQNLMKTCTMMQSTINGLMVAITGRFENFDRSTNDMWNNISAERFRKVEELISSYHTTIGGVLCALSVKMDAWARLFPKKDAGGPFKRAEFIMSEMKQGIDKIQKIEDSAPMLAELESAPESA
ncbi:MAG: hypothetical protein IH925_03955 [Proteobacteria bacterium]|nr:hypothetical protein [Pseudomonadota bacterium]